MTPDFHHLRRGRRSGNVIALTVVGLVLLGLIYMGAHLIFLVISACIALVLCVELFRDTHSFLTLTSTHLSWGRGARESEIGFDDIDEVRILRRLDLSQVVELRLAKGQKFRLPYDITPPIPAFEAALGEREIKVSRHAFSFL